MNTTIQYFLSFSPHLTFSTNFNIRNSIFNNITYRENHGGAIFMSKSEVIGEIIDCSFVNNIVPSDKCEGGSIYIDKSTKITINCTIFDHNSAFYSCSFWLIDLTTPFDLILNEVTIVNAFKTSESSHLDIFGGNPLLLSRFNTSQCTLPYYGFNIKFLEEEKHDIMKYIIYDSCTINDGYFIHDHNTFPDKYFCDNSIFINNNINNFYSIKTKKEITPSFFNCDFIFHDNIPNFNLNISFYSCYFQPAINQLESIKFFTILLEENGILTNIKSFDCPEIERVINSYQYLINHEKKHLILCSLFILNCN